MSQRNSRMRRAVVVPIGLLVLSGLNLGGCVMSEKYEAEKARSLNFQRLLAQEEKRSAELDSEVKRSKRELSEYEARNRELGAQVEAVRQQAAQIQEEAQAMKEASLLEKRAHEDMKRLTTIPSKTKKAAAAAKKDTVRSGETRYRIGQKYHVGVDQLRKWNNLDNNTVVVGQKLIVSRP